MSRTHVIFGKRCDIINPVISRLHLLLFNMQNIFEILSYDQEIHNIRFAPFIFFLFKIGRVQTQNIVFLRWLSQLCPFHSYEKLFGHPTYIADARGAVGSFSFYVQERLVYEDFTVYIGFPELKIYIHCNTLYTDKLSFKFDVKPSIYKHNSVKNENNVSHLCWRL